MSLPPSFSSSWRLRWRLRAVSALSGRSTVRLEAFLGSEKTSLPGLPASSSRRILCSWRLTRRLPPARSTSDHLSPRASPIRSPAARDRTYRAS